jgi:hypothetical protein
VRYIENVLVKKNEVDDANSGRSFQKVYIAASHLEWLGGEKK